MNRAIAAPDSELARGVRLNERVKATVQSSRQVYVIALNAMFAARQSHINVPGFTKVTEELRGFSQHLDRRMQGFRAGLQELVESGAEEIKQQRRGGHFQRAAEGCRKAGVINPRLQQTLAMQLQRREDINRRLAELREQLGREIRQAVMLCAVGEQLAVLAKVEATVGGDESELGGVAERLQDAIASIQKQLGQALGLVQQGREQA